MNARRAALAQHDGQRVLLTDAGCCPTAELVITLPALLEVLHAADCPALDEDHPLYLTARGSCHQALAAAYAALTGEPTVAVLADLTGRIAALTAAHPATSPGPADTTT